MLDLVLQHVVLDDPDRASALAHSTLAAARARSRAFLCSYEVRGDVLALGRYHVVPDAEHGTRVARRLTGGRPAPLGDGFVGMALALPDGRDLVRDDTVSVTPERVLNRAVRGLLGALESVGLSAYYPGRDVVTVSGRTVGALGIETAADGGVLVEASVAIERSFALVSRFADGADPAGVVPMDLVTEEQATCVADARGRTLDAETWTAALATGYARRLGFEVTMESGVAVPPPDSWWRVAGRLAPHLVRHAAARDLLGVVEVYAASDGRVVDDLRVCGDVIASSTVVAAVEGALRGAPVAHEELRRRAVAAAPGGLLGVRSTATIGDLVYEACKR